VSRSSEVEGKRLSDEITAIELDATGRSSASAMSRPTPRAATAAGFTQPCPGTGIGRFQPATGAQDRGTGGGSPRSWGKGQHPVDNPAERRDDVDGISTRWAQFGADLRGGGALFCRVRRRPSSCYSIYQVGRSSRSTSAFRNRACKRHGSISQASVPDSIRFD
jgi:hypothetical protein